MTHHLGADHGQRLALRWVDLTGHNGTAWFILRDQKFSNTATRP
jgi:hypothetical protein